MKPKTYWNKSLQSGDPFAMFRDLSRGVAKCARDSAAGATRKSIRYLWLYLTGDAARDSARHALDLSEWQGVVDESCSLGVEWIFIHGGTPNAVFADLWELCRYAQDFHGLRVAMYVRDDEAGLIETAGINSLRPEQTYVVAGKTSLETLRPKLNPKIRLCDVQTCPESRPESCNAPSSIACVGSDGQMFTCGLVLGDDHYCLGHALERGMRETLADAALPHAVGDAGSYPECGCQGCPSLIAQHIVDSVSRA